MNPLNNILKKISHTLMRYIVLPGLGAEAIALWIVATHLLSISDFAPILVVASAQMGSGKTTLSSLIGELVHNALSAVSATPAVLFRTADGDDPPTFLIDEYDTIPKGSDLAEALRQIYNGGFRRGKEARVMRMVAKGNDFDVRIFNIFGYRLISGIGSVPGTMQDRAIVIPLQRKKPADQVDRLRISKIEAELEQLRNEIHETALSFADELRNHDPAFPDELNSRGCDKWELMFSIADLASGDWPEVARKASLKFSNSTGVELDEPGPMLLSDIQDLFNDTKKSFLTSQEIISHLEELEERPWSVWTKGKCINPVGIARLLKPFEIRPQLLSIGGHKTRGYKKDHFHDSWERYLAPLPLNDPLPVTVNSANEANSLYSIELEDRKTVNNGNSYGNRLHVDPLLLEQEQPNGNTLTRYPLPTRYHENDLSNEANSLYSKDLQDSNISTVTGNTLKGGNSPQEESLSEIEPQLEIVDEATADTLPDEPQAKDDICPVCKVPIINGYFCNCPGKDLIF